jgi:DNA repair exonuclease SbcCD nuclease subunit
MKILFTGDWHYTNKTPISRIDDYPNALKNKIVYIFDTAYEQNVDIIIQPGDLTDSPFIDYSNYIDLFNLIDGNSRNIPIYSVYGQHDLTYRNKGNTPLDALHHSIHNFQMDFGCVQYENIDMYGVSYGEAIPEIANPTEFNILIIHKMILYKKGEDWQDGYDISTDFLSKNKFDLIISGDNHQSFMIEKIGPKKRFLFNCGSLMRSTIEQIDHKPCFYIFNTDTRKYEKFMIPIQPWQKCFDLEKKVKEDENDEKMKAYISGLKTHKSLGLNFVDNLIQYMEKNKVGSDIQTIIKSNMEAQK